MFFPQWHATFGAFLESLVSRRLVLLGHARPDGDCIGAQVGFAQALRSRGIDAVCCNPDPIPRRLAFLLGDTPFLTREALTVQAEREAIYLDCADHARAGERLKERFPRPLGNLDHHLSNIGYAESNLVDAQASATCELLAGLWLDQGLPLAAITAQALYTGIVTDTGQFRFPSTTQRTLKLATELFARGAEPARINNELYEQETLGQLQLLQRFLASLRLSCGGRVATGVLPLGIYAETGTLPEDAEGLVDYARAIAGVDIGVLIEEQPQALKASLRAKDARYRVDRVAAQFNGGGHACAAGLNVPLGNAGNHESLKTFSARLEAALATQLKTVDATPPSA